MGEKRVEMLSALIPLMEVMQPKVSLICWGEERKGKRTVKKKDERVVAEEKYRGQREGIRVQSNHINSTRQSRYEPTCLTHTHSCVLRQA